MIEDADLIVEASGDIVNSTEVLEIAFKKSVSVVTMNAELQITTGSYLDGRGFITEAEGDQPDCLAALRREVVKMGLKHGNLKNFLNLNPTLQEMRYWANKSGNRVEKITSFTDGTKVQIEQALLANGLVAVIAKLGLRGLNTNNVEVGATVLAEEAKNKGAPVSDYILSPKMPPGVFITDEADPNFKVYLGEGPYYTFIKNYHSCHFKAMKTAGEVLSDSGVLINNSTHPRVSVAAVAKREIPAGYLIKRGIGSFELRGIAINIKDEPDHMRIGLLASAICDIHDRELITFNPFRIPDSFVLDCWEKCALSDMPGKSEGRTMFSCTPYNIIKIRKPDLDHKVFPLNVTPKRGRCISPACTLLKVRTEPNVSAELISRVGAA